MINASTSYNVQNAGASWSFAGAGHSYRYEVKGGDHWKTETAERSETSYPETLEFGVTYTLSYSFMIEPGPANTSDWVNIGQFHAKNDPEDASGIGPVFAVKLVGEKMMIVSRSDPAAISTQRQPDNILFREETDVVRGHWYDFKMEFRFDPFGNGLINIWRDGVQIVSYQGPVGYNDQYGPYWKQGVYRAPAEESLAVNFKDTTLVASWDGPDGGAVDTASPVPSDTAPTTPPKNLVLEGDGGRDDLVGGAGNDDIKGGNGDNYLRGGDGNDVVQGGRDFDDAHGNAGNDTVYGGGGGDWVVGGKDQDMLFGDGGDDIVYGNMGADTCFGGDGKDIARGGQGNDSVSGGAGDDWLSGDKGNDTISGGAGADSFHSFSGAGIDRIIDFNAAEGDRLSLLPGTDYSVAQQGADTVVTMADAQMILVGVNLSALPDGWIHA